MNDLSLLAINWPSVGLKAAQLLLSLSILVVLHEFGHYITAKWFKCRVEKFYLFFDPWFSLFKKKIGETEYGIGWLPLGGYVKIAGMVDESMDKEQLKLPPQHWEFRSKPAWQRLIIMLGGVIMNILTAFVIYAFILMIWGEKRIPVDSMKYGLTFNDSMFHKIGFKDGDQIVAIDGKKPASFTKLLKRLIVVDEEVTVLREGKEMKIQMPENLIGQLVEHIKKFDGPPIEPRMPVIVSAVSDSSPSKNLLLPGDKFLAINGAPTQFNDEFNQRTKSLKKGDSVMVTVDRNNQPVSFKTKVMEGGKFGFMRPLDWNTMDSMGILKFETIKYDFPAAFPAGVRKTWDELRDYIDQFTKILNPKTEGYKGLGGFKGMANIFSGYEWNWEQFWNMTAFLSVILAFMNLLPIPALDGGHVMFTLYEMITGHKPSEKFLEYAQIVGMVILLALMLYANLNDWIGWGK